jgi:hypothetical protein
MMPFLTYLLKMAICSGLLTGYYYLALRNRAFHQWNRFYLLCTVLLSLTVPLLQFTVFHDGDGKGAAIQLLETVGSGDEYVVYVTRNNAPSISLEQGLVLSYVIISVVLLITLALSLLKLRALIKKHAMQTIQNIQFINAEVKGTPFSFFHYIFWNPSIDLQSENGSRIFQHELAHVRERHSVDKLLMQLVLICFWCNPFFWLVRHELRMIHEFIADRKALDQRDASALAAMILQAAYPTRYNQLINSFFHQSIKRRIHMLAKNPNPRFSYISRVLFIPLAACLVLAFSVRTKPAPDYTDNTVMSLVGQPGGTIQRDTVPVASEKIQAVNITKDGIEVVYKDGTKANLTFDEAEALGLNTEAMRKDSSDTSPSGTSVTVRGGFEGLVIVNGKEYKEDFQKIDPKTIQSVNVLKGPAATAKYGDKGKNGVLEIALKKPFKDFDGLVMVDGKEHKGDLQKVDPNTIQSMNVLKGEAASEKYGDKGKNGVIEITLKHPTTQNSTGDTVKPKSSSGPTLTKVETEAQFPGGVPEWRRFLGKNLKAGVPVDHGAPDGSYTVMVQLLIEQDGTLSGIKPLTKHGYGMEEEVVRTMKLSPKWVPARQNGRVVRAYRKQPITFVIASDGEKSVEPPVTLQSGATLTTTQLQAVPFSRLVKPEATDYTIPGSNSTVAAADYTISSGAFTIGNTKGGDIHEVYFSGDQPTERIKSLIANATSGDLITIDRRKGITKDGKEFKLPSLVYTVQ